MSEILIDCIGLTEAQKLAGRMLLGGDIMSEFVVAEHRRSGLIAAANFIREAASSERHPVFNMIPGPLGPSQVAEDMLSWLSELVGVTGSIAVIGTWGDPFAQDVLNLCAIVRATNQLRALDTPLYEWTEARQYVKHDAVILPWVLQRCKDNYYTMANGKTMWRTLREELDPSQVELGNLIQGLANTFQSVRFLSLFGDWLMEHHCIGRYQWLWKFELERQNHEDCFVLDEFDPIEHFRDVNGPLEAPAVNILPWDDSAQELYKTFREQRVNRSTFCTLDLVVLQQMMGVKLSPPTVAEIIN